MEPTVFVVPPNPALLCPLHFGVFNDPVVAPCGCTFCRKCIEPVLESSPECPIDRTPLAIDDLKVNNNILPRVNELLICCKYGLKKDTTGDWVQNTEGCKMWINLGSRKEHESVCPYKLDDDFCIIENEAQQPSQPKPIPPPLYTCPQNVHSCPFSAHTEVELQAHIAECPIGKLVKQIEDLRRLLGQRDEEIDNLNYLLEQERANQGLKLPTVNGQEFLNTVSRGVSKIEEESQHLMEEARVTILKTKDAVKNSSAFNNSIHALHSIKQAFESAHAEIVARLNELVVKANTTESTQSSESDEPAAQQIPEAEESMGEVKEEEIKDNKEEEKEKEVPVAVDDEDELIKKQIKASEETFRLEQQAKALEEEQLQQALRLSLLESSNKQ